MFIVVLLMTMFIASCTQTHSAALTQPEEFEHHARCASLWNPTLERIREEESSAQVAPYLEEMFYSPGMNTCMAAYQVIYRDDVFFVIRDAFSWNFVFVKNQNRDASALAGWSARRSELKTVNSKIRYDDGTEFGEHR